MQTEKSQPEGKQIKPETKFTEFPALSVDLRFGISRLHRRPMTDYFSYYDIKSYYFSFVISFIFDNLRRITTVVVQK